MDIYNATDIINYILYLRKECNLSVTLHINQGNAPDLPDSLMTFNIHDNPYCIYIKSCENARRHCIAKQQAVERKAADGSYTGNCYAGVREYVYPVTDGEKQVGFLCVGGYKTPDKDGYINAVADKFKLPYEKLNTIYSSLKSSMPDKKRVDTLIIPLLNMLELACLRLGNTPAADESFTDKIIRYLKRYHTENITSEDICHQFSCSRSHLSHEFNKHTGKSIKEYLTELRIKDAKSLLMYTNLTVTEIAFSIGYGDSNYFSNLFKSKVGVSPREYRKAHK